MAVAAYWVSRVTNISLEMVLPAGLGFWLDRRWGTEPWLLSVGACLGMIVAMVSLVRLSQQANSKNGSAAKTKSSTAVNKSERPVQEFGQQKDSDQQS
jgi:F0F1-type ATP synthase assembly protein I